ncbi:UDP-glycosyltransferase 74E2 [Linum perenne]
MEAADLPSFVTDLESYPGTLDLMTGQLANVADADWVFCNTFYSLEEKVFNLCIYTLLIRINPVGPTIPTAYLGKEESSKTTIEYGLSLFNQTGSQASITQWLDSKPLGSIIYASLGSLSDIPESQIVELANALHLSNHPFIWVVRASEQDKLPPNFTSNNATCLIVDWCHQLEILAHPSVGCFVTHCGWNSTIEAISIGVPMVTLPVWVDQPTNAKFVGDLWRVGARANANITSEVVTRDEIRRGIKEVMEGESGEEIRRNVEKWKRSAHEAVADGGSSSRNINEFVTAIKNRG